ncbi:MAG: hypothetical protein CMK09_10200 [Ponticaulis sp.]|nr:hypothetical protein [Ponticaulis sp.]
MFNKGIVHSALFVISTAICQSAQAENELNIKVGAHAFFDYENVEIDSNNVVDGTNLRLFRVDVKGSYGDYAFTSNVDLHGDNVKVQDLFIQTGKTTKLRVGNFKIMNGLEQSSSLYALPFVEGNSVSKVNGLGRVLGVGVFHSFDNVHVSGGLFSANVNNVGDDDEMSVAGRIAAEFHPGGEPNTLHLGASVRHRENADMSYYSYGQKPFASSAPKTVKTPGFAGSDDFLGLEAAFVRNGLSLQSEVGLTQADCDTSACSDDPSFSTYYVDASYMWGGNRVLKDGLFKRDKVHNPASEGGPGAFGLSARYDVADLTDDALNGGRQESFILGATWYRDKYIRVMADYIHAELEDSPAYGDASVNSLVFRLQAELY